MSQDRISKPAAARYFSLSTSELLSRMESFDFSTPGYYSRLPILMENCAVECKPGHQLGSFLRKGYVALFSLPELIPPATARKATEIALEHFSAIDKGPWLSVRQQQFVVYRAFLGAVGVLSITQHVVSADSRSYLQFRSATQLSRADAHCTGQLQLLSVTVV